MDISGKLFSRGVLRVAHRLGARDLTAMHGTGHAWTGQAPGLMSVLENLVWLALDPNVAVAPFFPPHHVCKRAIPKSPRTLQTLSDETEILPTPQESRSST